jgi:MFS family permease
MTPRAATRSEESPTGGSWTELLGREYIGAITVLAGGVAIYAINEFITMSLAPNMIADIGGGRFYAWVTTVYLVASVTAATTVGPVLNRFGPRGAYLGALVSFAAGSALCTLAPSMALLLVGRVVQGLAGGVLAGLGYAVISAALPVRLWTRASAVVSAMWGVGTLVGPAAGGLFAQFGWWRGGFALLATAALLTSLIVPVALPSRRKASTKRSGTQIPIWSLVLLGGAALTVSAADIPTHPVAIAALFGIASTLVVGFLAVDKRSKPSVLPRSVFGPGPLKWIYLTLGVLMASTMVDVFVPLFGQRLAGLAPITAGFLGAALSVGWTVGEISSASTNRARLAVRLVAAAPLVMAIGLGIAALVQVDGASVAVVAVWALALVIAGVGIGTAWPHLSAWAMSSVAEPSEQVVAAAAINTVQLICAAFGAGLAGVIVNARENPDIVGGRWLFGSFAALAVAGCIASTRAGRHPRSNIPPLR